MREAAQVVAYEIPFGIALMVPLITLGTMSLLDASVVQQSFPEWLPLLGGLDWGMNWAVLQNPFVLPSFVIFWIATLAETKRAPFDLPEAESELVAGFMTEYSGIRWSFFFMEEYAAMFLMSLVAAVFFFGGFETPATAALREAEIGGFVYGAVCFLTIVLKSFAGVFLMMWLRWTLPRIRIDQVMTLGYKYLTPLSLACLLGAALWEAALHLIF